MRSHYPTFPSQKESTYPPAGAVVVEVHERPGVPDDFLARVDEEPREVAAVLDVVAAAAPVEVASTVAPLADLRRVAGAALQLALAARTRYGVHDGGRGEGVHDSRLSTSCGRNCETK